MDYEVADFGGGGHEVGVCEDAVVFDVVDAECCVRPEEGGSFEVACEACLEDACYWADGGESSVLMMC